MCKTSAVLMTALISLFIFPAASVLAQQPETKKNDFIRLTRNDANEPVGLQTAIRTYVALDDSDHLQVDLVGAVHVGDKEYYQKLNKRFEEYDVVLYELVAPPGTTIPKGGVKQRTGNPISMLQGMMKNMLNLASQMEEVDYTRDNFVHADMSPAEMTAAMQKRGDTPITIALSAMSEMMRQSNLQKLEAEDVPRNELAQNPLSLLFDKERDTKLKLMMAEQFSSLGTDAMGSTVNQILVQDRNAAAMKVFQKELVKGHKRIAIFYGAAHLPDFEDRLMRDFGLVRKRTDWLTAWDLEKPAKNAEKAPDALDQLMRTLLNPPVQ